MATTESKFHTSLTALLQSLVNTAAVEICALAEIWSANLRMEITMSKSENDYLKRKLQLLEQRLSDGIVGEQDRKLKVPESGKFENKLINHEIVQTDSSGGRSCNHAFGEIKLEEIEMSVTGKSEDGLHGSERNPQSSEPKSESVRFTEPRFQKSESRGGRSIDCEDETCDSEHEPGYQIFENIHLIPPKNEEAEAGVEQRWVDSSQLSAEHTCLPQTASSFFNNSDHNVILEQIVAVSTSSAIKQSDFSDKIPKPSTKTKKKGPRFICNICGKSLSSKYSLTVHFTLHTGDRPYACTHCGKKFVNRTNLQIHQNIHTGEKPYACTLCPKTFADPSSLIKHKRVHT